jgi:riboflavin synthase alpha subunit
LVNIDLRRRLDPLGIIKQREKRKIQKKERIMKNTTRKIGDEILVDGIWLTIVEIENDGTAWAIDQDGEEFEIEKSRFNFKIN